MYIYELLGHKSDLITISSIGTEHPLRCSLRGMV